MNGTSVTWGIHKVSNIQAIANGSRTDTQSSGSGRAALRGARRRVAGISVAPPLRRVKGRSLLVAVTPLTRRRSGARSAQRDGRRHTAGLFTSHRKHKATTPHDGGAPTSRTL